MQRIHNVFIFAACASIGAATTAYADAPVLVSAGEHGAYSRLVLSPNASGAKISQLGDTIRITMPDAVSSVTYNELVAPRKAHRVAAASLDEGAAEKTLVIRLNCDCTFTDRLLTNNKTIIDISERTTAPQAAAVDKSKPTNSEPQNATQTEVATPATKQKQSDETAEKSAAEKTATPNTGLERLSVEKAQSRMLALLQQAAREGLVKIKDDPNSEDKQSVSEAKAEKNDPPAAIEDPSTDEEKLAAAIRRREFPSVAQDEPEKPKPTKPVDPVRSACLPASTFDLDAEAFDEAPLVTIAEMQKKLAQTDAMEQADIAKKLAAGFIAIGFGEEAQSILADFALTASPLNELARILAGKKLAATAVVPNGVDCDGAQAYWQAAYAPGDAVVSPARRGVEALEEAPTRLRTILATRIARKLVDANAWSLAKQYFQVASRDQEELSPDLQFVQARLLEHDGDPDASRETLRTVVASNTDAANDALLALAEDYADGQTPHEGFYDDIGVLKKVQQDDAAKAKAAYLEGVAWAQAGKLGAAVLLLKSAAEKNPAEAENARRKAREAVLGAATSNGNDAQFEALETYLTYEDFIKASDESPDFNTAMAEAARSIGLPNLAIDFLQADYKGADPTRALSLATTAMEADDPERALAFAAPFASDPSFAAIIVDANFRLQRFYAAIAAEAALTKEKQRPLIAADAAWRAADWAGVANAYAAADPSTLKEKDAFFYALAAFMAGQSAAPAGMAAALSNTNPEKVAGVEALFASRPRGPVLERGRSAIDDINAELSLFDEVLNDG
ncbi:MAG: hypothetical protein AAF850_05125 [Pseudomonadota bacterium]